MIISIIKQLGLRLRADPEEIPFQYSSNIQMQFIKDENYNDYTVVGYYIPPGQHEAKLLNINDDGTFILGPDCFKQRGILSFSFNLINSQEEIHLGSIDFEVRYAFGDGDTILPESEEVWISLVTKVAKDAIREDVELVKQKANEALQSASLANDKASEAEEYANNANQSAGSASLSASSALTAKNDAIAASNSAIQAKQDAEQSANNAKNSANTALENANKSIKAIETVTQIKTEIENKANDFDTNYQEKLKSFNDNATSKQNAFDNSVQTANTNLDNKVNQANSDLDAKVQEANTIIDKKVKTATEQAQKATDEANRAEQATDGKLDKNLGVENAGKSLVVGENGEVVCGETGINEDEVNKIIDKAIDEKLYTQEEVDYLLNDKMDKPYVSIEITDNATIDDALAGNFKIDKIKGNTYQKVETDIVPTPSRPVPINSRKVLANGEYVELRSLKESVNVWDYNNVLGSEGDAVISNLWATSIYAVEDNIIQLKPNTKYTCQSIIEMVDSIDNSYTNYSYEKSLRLYRKADNEYGLPTVNFIITGTNDVLNNGETKTDKRTFTTPEDLRGCEILGYTERWTKEGSSSVSATVKFKNIMLVEGDSVPSSYVAPTVRDYKIVDHVNKTAKIIRNVGLYVDDHTGNKWSIYNNSSYPNSYLIQLKDMKTSYRVLSFCNSFNPVNDNTGVNNPNSMWIGVNGTIVFIIKTNFKTLDEWKEWLTDNDLNFLYPLATPVEEQIPYLEDDVSEVGYSWQDSTSPSPDIKSEIYEVDEINIKLIGDNIFNVNGELNSLDGISADNKKNTLQDGIITSNYNSSVEKLRGQTLILKEGMTYTVSGECLSVGTAPKGYVAIYKGTTILKSLINITVGTFSFSFVPTDITEVMTLAIGCSGGVGCQYKNIKVEENDAATPYTPYQETSIQHALSKPLRATKDGSVRDIIDIINMQTTYNITDFIVDGNTEFSLGTDKVKTRVLQIDNQPFDNPSNTLKMYCDKLKNDTNKDEELFTVVAALYIAIDKNRVEANNKDAFVKWLSENPLYFIGISKTPTTEPLEDELVQKLKTLKTFSPVTHVFVEGIVKPTLNAKYPKDIAAAQAQLEQKVLLMSEALTETQAKLLLQGGN